MVRICAGHQYKGRKEYIKARTKSACKMFYESSKKMIHVTYHLIEPASKEEDFHIDAPKSKSGVRNIPGRDRFYIALQAILAARPLLPIEPGINGYAGFLFIARTGNPKRPSDKIKMSSL